MPSRIISTVMTAVAATTGLVALAAVPASAAGTGMSPTGTLITFNSSDVTFKGTLSGIPFSVSCTASSFSFTTPSPIGYGAVNTTDPVFGGTCKDTFGGTATVHTNHTNGPWTWLAIQAGPAGTATMPKAGATFSTATLPGCTVTAAPTGPVGLNGAYNNLTHTWTLNNAPVPFSAVGCGSVSPTGTVSGHFVSTPVMTIS
ncbi:hypothetical protein [Actinomadura oligospora]|uniref:hypothetical protein n=1 Tax=Actinomadura oligospora TaxID=111804 RepID=UPI000479BBC1|nr:hypothetical protein [Actinomadura oligospora]